MTNINAMIRYLEEIINYHITAGIDGKYTEELKEWLEELKEERAKKLKTKPSSSRVKRNLALKNRQSVR